MSPCGREIHQHLGLYQEEHQQGGDPSPLLSAGEAMSGVHGPVLGSQQQKDVGILKRVQQRGTKMTVVSFAFLECLVQVLITLGEK